MIYLDNSATSKFKPMCVKRAVKQGLTKFNSNPGRGSHPLSVKASMQIIDARINIANFFNAESPNNVIFTSGCTESLNLAILGTAKQNGHVIVSTFEHNSVLRTVNSLKKNCNINYSIIIPKNEQITISEIKNKVKSNTYAVIINHISNVTGSEQNIHEIGKFCKENNLIFIVDAAQSAGHKKIDVLKNNINALCVACHKGLLAPQGIGLLIVNNLNVKPIKFGGTGTNSESLEMPNEYPEKLECGTCSLPLIMATNASVKYVSKNFDKINNKIEKLSALLFNLLKENKNIIIYSKNYKNGVIAFNIKNVMPNSLVNYLNENKVCVRAGLHCAPLAHKFIGTSPFGCIRASVGFNNSKRDIIKFVKIINNYKNN